MNIGQQILFFFSALGVFNGFVLGTYLLFFKKNKSSASYFLGFLLFALSLRIGKAILAYFFYPGLPLIYLQIGLSGCFLIGPSLYYFCKSALAQLRETPKQWKYTFCFWIVVIVTIGMIVPYPTHPWHWNHYIIHLIYIQWAVYFVLSAWVVRKLFVKLFTSGESLSTTEKPILSIFIANAVVHIVYLIVFFSSSNSIYIGGALFFSLLLYLNIPLFMNSRKSNNVFLGYEEPERYLKKKITDEYAVNLTAKLRKTIIEQELYKNPDLKVQDLANRINITTHQLSQLLNDNLGKSFATYINEYRINAACNLIANDKGIKLEEIGYEVGFNSKSTFYTAFKKHKQTTPTIYKERLKAGPLD